MRKVILTTTALLLTVTCVGAQFPKLEMSRLREHLNLPATVNIATALEGKLPAGPFLKVYIATAKGDPTHRLLVDSFDKWNEKNGRKYGEIRVVSDLSQSDVILALYRIGEGVTPYNPAGGRRQIAGVPVSGADVARPPLSERLPNTLYSYLIIRKSDDLEIAYRAVVPLSHPDPEERVLNELKKRMKRR